MALKFLNKKGWHTGSLRNIENVWKAEQKHDAEQKKLEELRKQIQEERERSEFRQLQEQAGLVPRQERLDFLYESGLGVGKGSSDGFKALEAPSSSAPLPSSGAAAAAEGSSEKAAVPGALFEDKPQSANDAWRKLHSDPLLLIRQREQEALSRIKNNPIRMAMIRKSVEAEKKHKEEDNKRKKEKKHKRKKEKKHSKSRNDKHSDSKFSSESEEDRRIRHRTRSEHERGKGKRHSSNVGGEDEERRKDDHTTSDRKRDYSEHEKHSSRTHPDSRYSKESEDDRRARSTSERHHRYGHEINSSKLQENDKRKHDSSTSSRHHPSSEPGSEQNNRETQSQNRQGSGYNRSRGVPKMTEEEREARLREMQLDAELHEQQRWKRVKKAAEADAQEVARASSAGGKNFLDSAQKSIYGTEKGGSATIEESVRRRAYYSQGGTRANETNAFRR